MDYRRRAAEIISSYINISIELIYNFIEVSSKKEIWDLSFPCFKLCGIVNSNPVVMARELKCNIESYEFEKIENVGPYLNFFINRDLFVQENIDNILSKWNKHEEDSISVGKSICIEYLSSKNKNLLSLEEFFSIILSNSLSCIFRSRGYDAEVKEFMLPERKEYDLICNDINKSDISAINSLTNMDEYILGKLAEKNLICSEKYVKFISLEKYNMAPYIIWSIDCGITDSMKILTSVLSMQVRFQDNINIFISDSLHTYKFKQLSKILELFEYNESNFLCAEYSNIKIKENGALKGSTANISVSDILSVIVKSIENSSSIKGEMALKKSRDILVFSLLMNFRSKNIIIELNDLKVTQNEGLYYVENIYLRVLEIINRSYIMNGGSRYALTVQERLRITKRLIEFDTTIDMSMEQLEPAYLTHYILRLAQDIEDIFIKVGNERIFIWDNKDIKILKAVIKIIKDGLNLIGIELGHN